MSAIRTGPRSATTRLGSARTRAPPHRPVSSLHAIVLIGALATPAGAAESPSAPALAEFSLEQLANLEITSVSRKHERLSDAPASVFVITGEDIRRAGATSLPEALRLAPNLQVARVDARQYAISARGFNSTTANKLLVLIDGRTVYTPLFSGVFWDVQDVLLEDVERIEVISGPGATLWGTNAVAGVINVITRRARDTPGGLVSLGSGTREDGIGLRYGGRFGDTGSYRVYGKYFDREQTTRSDGTAGRDAWHKAQAGFRADWGNAAQEFELQGDAYRGEFEQPAPGMAKISGFNLIGRASRQLEGGGRLQGQAYFDRTEREIPGILDEKLDVIDVEFQHVMRPLGIHAVTWGADYRSASDRVRNSAALAFLPGDRDLAWWSLFAQDEIALRDDLRLTAGARLERNDYTGNEFLPSVRLAWKASPNHLLWSALSRAVRSPSRIDREFFVPGQPPFLLAGGPDFRSEVSKVVEIGYRAQPSSRASYSLTAFHHIHEHLRSIEQGPGGTFVIANRMEGSTSGAEAWGNYQVTPAWRLAAGAVILRQRLRLAPDSTSPTGVAAAGNDPRHHWLLRSTLDLPRDQELDVMVRRVGALPNPPVPAYVAVDARYGWRISREVDVSVTARNLFDRRHPEFGSPLLRNEIDRSVDVRLQWRF